MAHSLLGVYLTGGRTEGETEEAVRLGLAWLARYQYRRRYAGDSAEAVAAADADLDQALEIGRRFPGF